MYSQPQKTPTIIGIPPIGTKLLNRYVVPKVAMALVLVSSAVGVWLTLEGIGAASLDLALAKWVQFLALCVLIAGSAWGAFYARRRYNQQDVKALMPSWHFEFSRLADIREYAVAALIGSSLYVLVGYSLHFSGRYGPGYNGLIGLQGFVLLVLANVAYLSVIEPQAKGQGFSKVMVILSLLSLLLAAALDVVPFLGG